MAFNNTPVYAGAIAEDDKFIANLMNSFYVQRGLFANRPAAGNNGVVFIASNGHNGDAGPEAIYRDNGSTWDFLGRIINDSAQTITGIKTFGSIPVGPASNPTTDNQLARKKYVDEQIATTPNIAVGSYTGDGTTDRQITTGFIVTFVMVMRTSRPAIDSNYRWFAWETTLGLNDALVQDLDNTGLPSYGTTVSPSAKPHASDGIVVTSETNLDTIGYRYIAFG